MKFIIPIFLFIGLNAFGFDYKKEISSPHVIHIVHIDPSKFTIKIVKANNGKKGRETVSSMAKRESAALAINGGFFQIGDPHDGKPSQSLVIDGKVYGLIKRLQPLILIKDGILSIKEDYPKINKNTPISLISGIPLLIKDAKIPDTLSKRKGDFYTNPHARTAIGIDKDGKIIIVVAEHAYYKDLTTMTLGELQSLLTTKSELLEKNNPEDLTLKELKKFLKKEFTPQNGTKGLTMIELAKLMLDLGCTDALNLDGGGSSTLWMEGKVINNTFGDQDESKGIKTERPVSDAIIFKENIDKK